MTRLILYSKYLLIAIETRCIKQSKQGITKALIRLCGCTGGEVIYESESISNQSNLFPVEIHLFFFNVIAL